MEIEPYIILVQKNSLRGMNVVNPGYTWIYILCRSAVQIKNELNRHLVFFGLVTTF